MKRISRYAHLVLMTLPGQADRPPLLLAQTVTAQEKNHGVVIDGGGKRVLASTSTEVHDGATLHLSSRRRGGCFIFSISILCIIMAAIFFSCVARPSRAPSRVRLTPVARLALTACAPAACRSASCRSSCRFSSSCRASAFERRSREARIARGLSSGVCCRDRRDDAPHRGGPLTPLNSRGPHGLCTMAFGLFR